MPARPRGRPPAWSGRSAPPGSGACSRCLRWPCTPGSSGRRATRRLAPDRQRAHRDHGGAGRGIQDAGRYRAAPALQVEFLSPARLADLCPMLDTARTMAALWCPTDGYLQPNSLVTAYARAARDRGVTFTTHTTVTGLSVARGAVTGIRTGGARSRREDASLHRGGPVPAPGVAAQRASVRLRHIFAGANRSWPVSAGRHGTARHQPSPGHGLMRRPPAAGAGDRRTL